MKHIKSMIFIFSINKLQKVHNFLVDFYIEKCCNIYCKTYESRGGEYMKPKTKKFYQISCLILATLLVVPTLLAVIFR